MEAGPPEQQPPQYPQPPSAPEAPPGGYQGQMPPGGWQYPVAPVKPAWAGPPLASWGARVGAQLLDVAVVVAAGIVLLLPAIVAFIAGSNVAGVILIIIGGLAYLVVGLLYASYFMARRGENNGQSLGKQWVGIRAVRDDGNPFNFGTAFLREVVIKGLLFGTVGGFFLYIPTLLDYLWPLWEDENRCLHDLVASTHVVKA